MFGLEPQASLAQERYHTLASSQVDMNIVHSTGLINTQVQSLECHLGLHIRCLRSTSLHDKSHVQGDKT